MKGDSVFACTDGIPERANPSGALFGWQRLKDTLQSVPPGAFCASSVLDASHAFAGAMPAGDDTSLIEILVPDLSDFAQRRPLVSPVP